MMSLKAINWDKTFVSYWHRNKIGYRVEKQLINRHTIWSTESQYVKQKSDANNATFVTMIQIRHACSLKNVVLKLAQWVLSQYR